MKTTAIKDQWITYFSLIVLTMAVLLLSACGGGGSSSSSTPGATPTAGLASGSIEGFGSVIVNGVRFHTGGADLSFDDGSQPINLTDDPLQNQLHLSVGMEVEVEGSFDDNVTGTATRITVNSSLEGPITNLSAVGDVRTFTILGQNVLAGRGSTVVDDSILLSNLDNLQNGMVVEIHGLPDGNGSVQASFIEHKANNVASLPPGSLFEITGTVQTGSLTSTSFQVGSQLVDYSNVTPRNGTLSEGALVEVKGDLSGTTLVASDVELKNGFGNQAKIDIEGLITALNTTAKTFMLKGQLVNYTNTQLYRGGVEADLANGLKVEAEGPISGGQLLAVKIKFKSNLRYEGAATRSGNTLLISNPAGSNLSVTIDSTMTRDESSQGSSDFRVRARQLSGANLLATRVRDDSASGRQIFRAPVIRIVGAFVEILDNGDGTGVIAVNTAQISDNNFEIEGVVTNRTAFFAALKVGDVVKARHDGATWDQIEIELED